MRYGPKLPLVLKGVSMHLKKGDKVSIIGRTGCGKSTTVGALFSLYKVEAGSKIYLNGKNVLDMELDE